MALPQPVTQVQSPATAQPQPVPHVQSTATAQPQPVPQAQPTATAQPQPAPQAQPTATAQPQPAPQPVVGPPLPIAPVTPSSHPEPAAAAGGSGQGGPTAGEIRRLVDEACEFILGRKEAHAKQMAWEVGEYLFERVYRGDVGYAESRETGKADSLYDIAARTGIGRLRLAGWIRAYIARKYLGAAGIVVDLSMSDFEALRPLALHPEAARAVLELRERHRLTTKQLDALAVAWRRRLDEGGRLEDLVVALLPASATPRPRPSHAHGALADGALVPIRLVLVVGRWLRSVTFAPRLRAGLRDELLRLRAAAVSGSPTSPASSSLSGLPAPPAVSPVAGPAPGEGEAGPAPGVIDAAVDFIRSCVRRHGLRFALEVGEHLFERVYGGDRGLFRNGGLQWQRDTIQRIAVDHRVQLESSFLYKAIHVYLVVGAAGSALPAGGLPELPLTTWGAMWPLEGDPEALVGVGTWAATEGVPAKTVAEIASIVAPYLAGGGSLEDLLAGSRRRPPDTPYRRVRRVLSVVGSMLGRQAVSAAAVPRLLSALDACVAAVGAGGGGEGNHR
ncbi:MAG: hypothetical protein HY905_21695 [Deltaproteobacteria bacterium]|nr:hypothetical protein [Deltaproteobacteria bacterium]